MHSRHQHSWDGFAVDIATDGRPRTCFVSVCRFCGLMASWSRINRGGLGRCDGERPKVQPGHWISLRERRYPWWHAR